MLIDTHTHLYLKEFFGDIDAVISRAKSVGVSKMLLPNIDSTTIQAMNALGRSYPEQCLPMIGLHPCSVKKDFRNELEMARSELQAKQYIAIGETGLDFHWDTTFVEQQKDALKIQIGWAKEHKLPIVLHSRESFDHLVELIAQHHDENLRGVFHCFTGSVEQALRVAALEGFYLGIGGVVTYKNTVLRDTLREIGLERVVLETDSPYLTPVPHRGKRNESSYVKLVAEKVADACGNTLERVAEITTRNAITLFGNSLIA